MTVMTTYNKYIKVHAKKAMATVLLTMGITAVLQPLLTACSDDAPQASTTLEAIPCGRSFEEEEANGANGTHGANGANEAQEAQEARSSRWLTRAWTPPTGYSTYADNYKNQFREQVDMFYKSIEAFFTSGNEVLRGTFFYRSSNSQWRFLSDLELETKDYQLYGYIPKEIAESSEIAPNVNYDNGAVLTLHGLKTITHSDVSVVVGASNGSDADNDGDLQTGDFNVEAKATSTEAGTGTGNFIFLLFDHLYGGLRFSFKTDPTYAELRTIKITRLELTALSNSNQKLKAKYNAEVTLQKNDKGTSPLMSINFTPVNESADVSYETIYSGEEVELPSDEFKDFMGCFVPNITTNFILRTTYNVYDRKGNITRKGCQAENAIELRRLYNNSLLELQRGRMFTIKLTVKPTYLYVLSDADADLDSPTITTQ